MKKSFKTIVIALVLTIAVCLSLAACTVADPATSVTPAPTLYYGRFAEVPHEEDLYYDPETQIVYYIRQKGAGYARYGYMSPYYAPNGLPYKYDTDTQTLVEISLKNP